MNKINKIHIPQFAANDDEVQIIDIFFKNGDKVNHGDLLGDFEASKVAFEIEAETEGYFFTPYSKGEMIATNSLFCIISDESQIDSMEEIFAPAKKEEFPQTERALYTQKSKLLAIKHNIDIETVPYKGNRLTEKDVLAFITKNNTPSITSKKIEFSNSGTKIAIIGAGPSTPIIIDALSSSSGAYPVAIFDDNKNIHNTELLGIPIVGSITPALMHEMHKKGAFDKIVISINSSTELRLRFYNLLKQAGFNFANIIHEKAYVSPLAKLGEGNVILPFCNISPFADIGNNNYMSPYTSIEHNCTLQDHCSFGPGVLTSGYVKIESKVKFGTGIFIEPHLTIGTGSTIASGAILTRNISSNTTVKSKENLIYRTNK